MSPRPEQIPPPRRRQKGVEPRGEGGKVMNDDEDDDNLGKLREGKKYCCTYGSSTQFFAEHFSILHLVGTAKGGSREATTHLCTLSILHA